MRRWSPALLPLLVACAGESPPDSPWTEDVVPGLGREDDGRGGFSYWDVVLAVAGEHTWAQETVRGPEPALPLTLVIAENAQPSVQDVALTDARCALEEPPAGIDCEPIHALRGPLAVSLATGDDGAVCTRTIVATMFAPALDRVDLQIGCAGDLFDAPTRATHLEALDDPEAEREQDLFRAVGTPAAGHAELGFVLRAFGGTEQRATWQGLSPDADAADAWPAPPFEVDPEVSDSGWPAR